MPTSRGSVRVIAMSGISPHLTSSTDMRASGVANRMSAASAIWRPPPRQWPWIAAITGTGTSSQPWAVRWNQLGTGPCSGIHQRVGPGLVGHHAGHVEPRAEARPLAVQHDRAHARLDRDARGGGGDRVEHRDVERVVLLGPGQGDGRDVVGHVDRDALPSLDGLLAHRPGTLSIGVTASPTRTDSGLEHPAVDAERQRLGGVETGAIVAQHVERRQVDLAGVGIAAW